ncbi:MAG: DUF5685 family protein [Clostridia bacterium]|nr:DUF5685 family protein [Clostridia bacterium]
MFGYVLLNEKTLSEEEKKRYRACYCGLCDTLKEEYGSASRLTLSNDMTFLALVLSALYEPEEKCYDKRCAMHPTKPRTFMQNEAVRYAAAMNILLAYYKCADDAADENSLRGRAGMKALQKAYDKVQKAYPRQCDAVKDALERLNALETQKSDDIDALARLSGQMLGECFCWREDVFAAALRGMGSALGRFIYLMDAWEDYDSDTKSGHFNPLTSMHPLPDYEQRMEDILNMEMAQCVRCYDYLPVQQDDRLIRNVLYSGVWGKYASLRQKRKETDQ